MDYLEPSCGSDLWSTAPAVSHGYEQEVIWPCQIKSLRDVEDKQGLPDTGSGPGLVPGPVGVKHKPVGRPCCPLQTLFNKVLFFERFRRRRTSSVKTVDVVLDQNFQTWITATRQ